MILNILSKELLKIVSGIGRRVEVSIFGNNYWYINNWYNYNYNINNYRSIKMEAVILIEIVFSLETYFNFKNHKGAFLIPFFIFMVLVGIPIMYLELAVGQFTSRGPILSWVMVPLFKGINYFNLKFLCDVFKNSNRSRRWNFDESYK